ncbi:MAG: coproporphyrinogen-III oxidase family protein [Candidatus Ornithospirochaeta sp.]
MVGYDPSLPVSLYIHIPVCAIKCDYCAFYSRSGDDEERDKYFSLLMAELEAVKKEIGKPFHTIFIGGGNPGLLGWERIRELILSAEEYGKSSETTIECNPENLDPGISILQGLVDRISVGIQSMNESVLKTLGRRLDAETNRKALELLSSLPFRWNADIITAVPGETVEDTLSDIRKVASYSPGHISFYCLTFEEGTPLVSRLAPMGGDKEAEYLVKGWELLSLLGYRHYEVSNFARQGEECIHNKVYWNLGQYIGLGPSAESALGWNRMVSMRNRETLEEYFSSPSFDCVELTEGETEESYLLTALRTDVGISKREYMIRFGKDFDSVYSERISLLDRDVYVNDENRFRITEEGMLTLDGIILTLSMAI